LAERCATMESASQAASAERERLEAALNEAAEQMAKLKKDMEAQMLGTVQRSDYEALRTETDKARNDLSTALSRYANLQQRFNAIDKAASIEKLKAALSQEEKAHGGLRIQYRNLETKLYEAVGGRNRIEKEHKIVTKERDELLTKLKAFERGGATRVKVTLPPEVANPSLEATSETEVVPAKKRASRKKATQAAEPTSEETSENTTAEETVSESLEVDVQTESPT
jgi:hypothetical protein